MTSRLFRAIALLCALLTYESSFYCVRALAAPLGRRTVSGHIVTSDGKPVPRSTIVFTPLSSSGEPQAYKVRRFGSLTTRPITTEVIGGYFKTRIPVLEQGCFRVTATPSGGNRSLFSTVRGASPFDCVRLSPDWCSPKACDFDLYTPVYPLAEVRR